jgi:hypothetical protein
MSGHAWSGKEVSRALPRKGFQKKDGDHHFYILYVDGRKTPIRTKVSHGTKDYTGGLWQRLRKQLKLSNKELQRMLECSLNHEAYVKILMDGGHI